MANTASAVWVEILPSMKGFGAALAQQAAGAGTRTGDAIGAELEKAAGAAGKRAGDAMATGVEAAAKRVQTAASTVATARNKEADAAGKVRVAEQKLEELRADGKSGSVIAAAEERLATARRGLEVATVRAISSAHDLEIAEHRAAQATDEVGDSSDRAADRVGGFGSGMADIGKKAAGFAVAMVAVTGGMDLFQQALSETDLAANLQAKLGTTPAMAAQYGQIAGELYASNYGESLGAVNDAIGDVVRSGALMEDATSEQIKTITGEALNLSQVFGQDVAKVMRSIGTMMRTGMAPDAQSAMDIVTRGFQQGVDIAEDYLDTLNEYSIQFQKLGLDGKAATGLLSQGLKAGARDADTVADALKEFSIRALDGSDLTIAGFKALGLNASDMAAQIGRGGQDASAGLQTVLDGLRGIEDPVARSRAAVALFGTKAEDLGQALYALDPSSAVAALGNVGGAAQAMGDTLASSPSAALATFGREVQTWIVDLLGGKVIPIVATVAVFLRDNFGPAVAAASTALAEFGMWVQRNADWLVPLSLLIGGFVLGYAAVTTATSLWAAKTVVLTAAQWLLNTALSANPIGLIIGLIVGLVAAFVWLWNNNEGFRQFWIDLWKTIQDAALWAWENVLKPTWDAIVTGVKWIADAAVSLWHAFEAAWQGIATAATWLWETILKPFFDGLSLLFRIVIAVLYTVLVTPMLLAFRAIAAVAMWLWDTALRPVFEGTGALLTWLWQNIISPVVDYIVLSIQAWGAIFSWLWNEALQPFFVAVGEKISWLWNEVFGPAVDLIKAGLVIVGAAFSWLWNEALQPAISAIGEKIDWLWSTVIQTAFSLITGALGVLGSAFSWVYNEVIKKAWDALGATIGWVWDNVISVIFGGIKTGVGLVGEAFGKAVDFIEQVWDKIKKIAAVPVNFVINQVYNQGIRRVWNGIADFLGLGQLPEASPVTFAHGGVLPGYAPGVDSIPVLASPGEGWLVPEAVRGLGPGFVGWANRFFSGGRSSGGANTGGGQGFSQGGVVQRFADGGVVGSLLGWVPGIGDDIVALWKDPKAWVKARIGGSGGWVDMLASIPETLLGKAVAWLTEKIDGFLSLGGGGSVSGDLAGWIGAAIKIAGVDASWFGPLSTLIMRESGGNPNAINLWDSNAQAGYPSQGLMQTIPQTFAAYRDQRLVNSITDPIANIVAGINYIRARYGSIFNVQQAVGSTPLGYDSGGYLPPGLSTVYNGTGRPEPVMTSGQWDSLESRASNDGEPVRIVGTLTVAEDGLNVFVTGHIDAANQTLGTAVLRRRR